MKIIRNGTIARLPEEIREELNARLARHESSTPLLKWPGRRWSKPLTANKFNN